MSDSFGTKEIAKRWGYTENTIRRWCREGKIKGADQDSKGSPWRIPKDANCPGIIKKKSQQKW